MPSTDPDGPVGAPHRGSADGLCLEDCPHPAHTDASHLVVAISPALHPLLGEWLEALGVQLQHVPTPPEVAERHYAAVILPGSPAAALLEPSAIGGHIRPPRTPRDRSKSTRRIVQR